MFLSVNYVFIKTNYGGKRVNDLVSSLSQYRPSTTKTTRWRTPISATCFRMGSGDGYVNIFILLTAIVNCHIEV